MRLFIAEKPLVAGDLVKAIGGNFTRKDGYFESGNTIVTWCFGHILENSEPEDFNPSYKKWTIEDLPLRLYPIKLKPVERAQKQVDIVLNLIKRADEIIHAGDPDDEGQLLVDELLDYAENTKPVKRFLNGDNTDSAVKKALANLKDNIQFKGLSNKALARSVGDDIYGKSMTRAYTVTAQKKGYRGKPLSVGRVQTPILGLICRRWLDNKSHKSSEFYTLIGSFNHNNKLFNAKWEITEDAPQDEKKRLINKKYGDQIAESCTNKDFTITDAVLNDKQTAPPLPLNLVRLQQIMNKKNKMTAARTLEITQQLREKYKAITYNRSSCSYLSDEQYSEAPELLAALKNISVFSTLEVNSSLKSKAFDSSQVTAHTAIIPTVKVPDLNQLSEEEKNVFLVIANYYLVQFLPNESYQEVVITVKNGTATFKCQSTKITDKGFTTFLNNKKDEEEAESETSSGQFDVLLALRKEESVRCSSVNIESKKTAPPELFTESSLLGAMVNIANYVENAEIKALLKAKDKGKKKEDGGIGTPATRDSIIEKLKEREFITLDKNKLIPTSKGLDFYNSLPVSVTNPDLTAYWAEKQDLIEQGEMTVDAFVNALYEDIKKLLDGDIGENLQISASSNDTLIDSPCPNCGKSIVDKPSLFVCQGQCGFKIWKSICGKTLSTKQVDTLISKGKTGLIKGFKSKAGKTFDAKLLLGDKTTGKVDFEFEKR